MLYREIIAVCSQIHTKHINTLCGQNVELLNVKLVVHIVTTGRQRDDTERPHTTAEDRRYIAVRTDTTQQSRETPDKKADIHHSTDHVSGLY